MATYFNRFTRSFNPLLTSLVSFYLHVYIQVKSIRIVVSFNSVGYKIQQNEFYQQTNNTLI